MSDSARVSLAVDGLNATITFDRPHAHNAMSPAMYAQLCQACDTIDANDAVRVVTLRGAGGKAFVAGSDIEHFVHLSAEEGFESDRALDATIDRLERLSVPTIAALEGWVMGAGVMIAAACDLRVATPDARFGVPIARTLGNCLSSANTVRLLTGFGVGSTKRMLLLAETLTASEALAQGFLLAVVNADEMEATIDGLRSRLLSHAPLTLLASKEAIRRSMSKLVSEDEDLVRLCYGSTDFKEGVAAFLEKRRAHWSGR